MCSLGAQKANWLNEVGEAATDEDDGAAGGRVGRGLAEARPSPPHPRPRPGEDEDHVYRNRPRSDHWRQRREGYSGKLTHGQKAFKISEIADI